jgi:soluble lytic murein transglycosylase-like protein
MSTSTAEARVDFSEQLQGAPDVETLNELFSPQDLIRFKAYCDFVDWFHSEDGEPLKDAYMRGEADDSVIVSKYINHRAQTARQHVQERKTLAAAEPQSVVVIDSKELTTAISHAANSPERAKDIQQWSRTQKLVGAGLLGLTIAAAPHLIDTYTASTVSRMPTAELANKTTAITQLSTKINAINTHTQKLIESGDKNAVTKAQTQIKTNTAQVLQKLETTQPREANVAATSAGREYIQQLNTFLNTLNNKVATDPNASPAQVLKTQSATAIVRVAAQYPAQIPASLVVTQQQPELQALQNKLETDLFSNNMHYTPEQGQAVANLLVQAFQPSAATEQATIVDPNGPNTLPVVPAPTQPAPSETSQPTPDTSTLTTPATPNTPATQAPNTDPSATPSTGANPPSQKPNAEKKETKQAAPILKSASVAEFANALEPLIAEGGNQWPGTSLQLAQLLTDTAERYKIPLLTRELLASQIWEESRFNPNAVSNDGQHSVGLSQAIPGTWNEWGKDLNGDGIANPRDPAEATDMEARFLINLLVSSHNKFPAASDADKIKLALYAYNAGPDYIRRTMSLPLTGINTISAAYIVEIPNHVQELDSREGIFGPFTVFPAAAPPVVAPAPNNAPAPAAPGIPAVPATTAGPELSTTPDQIVDCPAGATDLGVTTGYRAGLARQIRLCAIPNISANSEDKTATFGNSFYIEGANGHAVVNADVAQALMNMANDAQKDGINLEVNNSFRSKDNQQSLCPCDGITKAIPGYSNHGLGHALDFSANSIAWLQQHAADYGFFANVPNELWHYSWKTGH